jgi:hypothetical protein
MHSSSLSEEEGDLDLTPLEFTELAIRHKGEPINLQRRPWLTDIYDISVTPKLIDGREEFRRKLLLVFGRQSEKSTSIGNLLIALCNLIPFLRALYVSASDTQMREFSDERLRAVIATSPILQRMVGVGLKGHLQTQNVQTKRWITEAKIALRAAYRNADRVRGISADLLTVDEIQDVIVDILPIIEEVLFHSELEGGPFSVYAGTPKTFDNALEFYWGRHSTQNEWVTKCLCGKWAVIEENHVGPTGLQCLECSRELNPVDLKSQWARMGTENAEWEGFHLCQPIVVYAYRDRPEVFHRMWQGLLIKQNRYPRQKWMNEVMGRSYDAGLKPVTSQEVRDCSIEEYEIILSPHKGMRQSYSWAGIDWGTGSESYSVISIWCYDSNARFRLLFAKRYEGQETDPDYVVEDMVKWIHLFGVNRVGADWGFGFHTNRILMKKLGAMRVIQYQYAGNQKEKVAWDKMGGKFIAHRSRVMQDFFSLIKKGPVSGGIAFPNWKQFETFARDILSVYSEYNERSRQLVFNHPPGVPDDFLHTGVLALLVSQFDHRRPDLHAPGTGKKFSHLNMRR